jgi:serine/threonine protein kinase/Flp pilus assembly protein TadD
MSNDWQHLQSLFHAALSLKVEDRAAYLAHACLDDEELRTEVEALIEASERREDFLEQPALSAGLRVLAADPTEELTGQLIGSFKIIRLLGKGGMGNVYLAEETQLGRKVALKFLSGKWADNQWAKRQFAKEAQAVARLDHQNICPVHRFEEANGYSFIVMHYVEGERLDQLIQSRKVELREALSFAIKIASALAHAHAHGIIHRDVKPSNVMVSVDGQLKVLDFGLAKIVQQQQDGLSAEAPSNNSLLLGFIPGTVPYMSPEQLRGQRLDYRTDIFSFGVVLYELINGSNPFARDDNNTETTSTSSATQPQSLKPGGPRVSRELNRVVQKCLENERSARYQSVSELLTDLEGLQKLVDGDRRSRWYPNVRAVAAITLLLLLVTVATFAYGYLARSRTVVVLPIANATGNVKLDYLCDGLTESFINKLSRLGKLSVKPFSTVAGYKGQQVEPQRIGRDLKTDAVIFGKIIGTEDALSLQVVMIDTGDGSRLWGNIYKIGLADFFHVEDDVTRQLTSKLELWPRTDEAKITVMPRARTPEAYDQYMLGRYYWRLRDKRTITKAIEHFTEAIKLDPLYAPAYAGLADCFVLLNTVHYGNMGTKEAMAKAEAAAREALLLDDTLAEAHTALGDVYWRRYWKWAEAEKEFKRAIELDANFAPAHYGYSNLLAITGRLPAAISQSEIANSLDPFSPPTNMNYCRTFYFARDYEHAGACFEKLVKEQPDYGNGRYVQGLIYLQKGMYQEATRIFEELYAADKTSAGAALGYTYGVTNRKADALRVLSELKALKSDESYISSQEFAIIYMGLGEKDNAFIWLKKAADEHFAPLAYSMVDPLFDSVRSDGRFAELTRSLNLPFQPSE